MWNYNSNVPTTAVVTVSCTKYSHSKNAAPFHLAIPPRGHVRCLSENLSKYLTIRDSDPGPVFTNNLRPLNRYFFTQQLNLYLTHAGLDTAYFKSHSLRVGSATTEICMGQPMSKSNIWADGSQMPLKSIFGYPP